MQRYHKEMVKFLLEEGAMPDKTDVNGRTPLSIAHEHHLDLYGPTSIQKIEAETLKQGLDIFVQFDHQTPLAIMGEGTAENPFLIPSRNQCR